MATKEYSNTSILTADKVTATLYSLVDTQFPLSVVVIAGQIASLSYDTNWKEGGTTAVEVIDKKTKQATIENKENYDNKKLSSAQIKKIDAWIQEHITEIK